MASSGDRLWAKCWDITQRMDDESVRTAHVRVILLPFLRDLGYPTWFLETIVQFTRGVLTAGRPYSLEEVVFLLERTYGISPASPVPRS